jgi:soluble lytic murein transglycosylase-like protein
MFRQAVSTVFAACCLVSAGHAQSTHSYDALIATHAAANGVPEALVRRVILRESRYQASLVGRGGTLGLMQIKLATARGLGYTGTADGLLDPNTNLTYAVKYLAGAYRTAGGNADRAVGYYASGYYYAAKHQRLSARVAKTNPQLQNASGEPSATASIAVHSTRTSPAEERVGAR